jgi:hypothetical protein
MSLRYVDYFMSLKCAGDVLNVCNPVQKISKEVSEAMAIIFRLKTLTICNPMKYNIVDLCAGNSLISVISAMLLPVSNVIAVDKKDRNRNWQAVRRFQFVNLDIYESDVYKYINENTIITSCHPCDSLALRCADIFMCSSAKALFMMPCCSDSNTTIKAFKGNQLVKDKLNKYELWCLSIFNKLQEPGGYKTNISYDTKCLSPKNLIISAERQWENRDG